MAATILSRPPRCYVPADNERVATDLSDVDPTQVVHGLPVRIPVSRAGQRNYSGWYRYSTVQGHPVYESLLERDRLLLQLSMCYAR